MLKLQPAEPEWLGEIPSDEPEDPRPYLLAGVRVQFAPISRKAVRAAREAVRDALVLDEKDMMGAADALSEELITRGILLWEGVGDANGDLVPVTPEAVALFLADIGRFEAADRVYVRPWSQRDIEKNAFAGSPPGTLKAATLARDTASSVARPRTGRGATSTRKPGAKKPAPIVATSR